MSTPNASLPSCEPLFPGPRLILLKPRGCEFVLAEVGTPAGLDTTLHLADPVLCGPSRILGRLGALCVLLFAFSISLCLH
jgi:hypothetical protein